MSKSDISANPQYVTLGVMQETFAAPVERVQEILEMRAIARLPRSPIHLLGMIDVRGEGIPVVDLRLALGFPAAEDTPNTRIVVLRVISGERELRLGLRSDRVFEVTVLDTPNLEPAPELSMQWGAQAIRGIGRRNGAFVTVLDLDNLFASISQGEPGKSTEHSGRAA